MKKIVGLILTLVFACCAFAQAPDGVGVPKRTPDELQKLLSPIAIYPDSLIALILPASTASADVVLASRYLAANGDPNQLDNQAWDPSVAALARYPEVIKWMDQNLEWTRQLGEAFANQPADVMNAIQALRKKAQQSGLLQSNAQQQVVERDQEIYIEPASPDVIYVPVYDPDVIYWGRPVYNPWLTFSVGFAVGNWLYYDCDWGHRSIYVYHRPPGWVYRPGWRWHDHNTAVAHHELHEWHPGPGYWNHRHGGWTANPHRPVPHVEHPHFYSGPVERHEGHDGHPSGNWQHSEGHDRDHGAPGSPRSSAPDSAPHTSPPAQRWPGSTQHWGPTTSNGSVNSNRSEAGAPSQAVTRPQFEARARAWAQRQQGSAPAVQPQTEGRRFAHEGAPSYRAIAPRGTVAPTAAPPAAASRTERVGALAPRQFAPPPRVPDNISRPAIPSSHYAAPRATAPAPAPRSAPSSSSNSDSTRLRGNWAR